jgi:hypothetical protein
MRAVLKIREVLEPRVRKSRLLIESMTVVPSAGATPELLARFDRELPRPLSDSHRALLSVWNGIDLDVLRILGVPPTEKGIRPITDCQGFIPAEPGFAGAIAFASDPSGYVYFELPDGSVYSWDHDGGNTTRIASTVDDFIENVVFGARGAEFAGEKWLHELQARGLA